MLAAKRLSTSLREIPDVPDALSDAVEQLVGFLEEKQETQD
jgi:hypothetical protein